MFQGETKPLFQGYYSKEELFIKHFQHGIVSSLSSAIA